MKWKESKKVKKCYNNDFILVFLEKETNKIEGQHHTDGHLFTTLISLPLKISPVDEKLLKMSLSMTRAN